MQRFMKFSHDRAVPLEINSFILISSGTDSFKQWVARMILIGFHIFKIPSISCGNTIENGKDGFYAI